MIFFNFSTTYIYLYMYHIYITIKILQTKAATAKKPMQNISNVIHRLSLDIYN